MELQAIKQEIYRSVEQLNDEQMLEDILQLLRAGTTTANSGFFFEATSAFKQKIEEARQSIAIGNGISHVSAMKSLNDKWRQ